MVGKCVFYFGPPKAEGDRHMKLLLGGKGANLAEMVHLGIPVPPGMTVSTDVCRYYAAHKTLPEGCKEQIEEGIRRIEKEVGKKYGDASNALLFSVRSGAAVSMPGMMDTVLNLGLNVATVENIASQGPKRARYIYDSFRRFISMYADVVMQVGREEFEHLIDKMKKSRGRVYDNDFTTQDLKDLCDQYLQLYERLVKAPFPQDPRVQLYAAVNAVFRSSTNPRATAYRRLNNISEDLGMSAVNIQAIVAGNFNDRSCTGVAFSRSPSDGTNLFYGEWLINAQGEDVVAGIRTPQQISIEMSQAWAKDHGVSEHERRTKFPSMEEAMPDCYKQLVAVRDRLEDHFRNSQDMEFTVEDGRFWMLQTRNAKTTARAAVKLAVDFVKEGRITEQEAVMRVAPSVVDHLLHPSLENTKGHKAIAKGLPASPGAAAGQVVFNAKDAVEWAKNGKKVVMVRLETSPEDLTGMHAAQGFVTARGGMTSHAAVVARGMGRTCVAGCGDLHIAHGADVKTCDFKGVTFNEGDWITIDGTKGLIYKGQLALTKPEIRGDFETLISWCKKFKRLGVRANADTIKDASTAYNFGAEGIGLCRTEHMFFEGTRIDAMREMILAKDIEGRKAALAKVLPLQRNDFIGILRAMQGQPVTIRLLDPPLHEFVPHEEKAQADLAAKIGIDAASVARRVKQLHEENPMLGHRGCRLGISYPEIYNMQVQAIIEAAVEVRSKSPVEIMIPLVGKKEELTFTKEQAIVTAEAIMKAAGVRVPYSIGTMIEVPRAALTADEIATEAEFFSFGTNDLTQMGCGFSRDDSGPFLRKYIELGIYERDPFQSIDQGGVGQLVRIAVQKGRSVAPRLKCGVCGEHGGDPTSIGFFHNVGLDYVSCSPYRVPVALVAAAHAAIGEQLAIEKKRQSIATKSKL